MKLPEKIDAHAGSGQWRTTINQLIDYLAEREKFHGETPTLKAAPITITLPKPEWWDKAHPTGNEIYREALEAASKASGITFLLED